MVATLNAIGSLTSVIRSEVTVNREYVAADVDRKWYAADIDIRNMHNVMMYHKSCDNGLAGL